MKNILTRYVITICILIGMASFVFALSYEKSYKQKDALKTVENIPMRIGDWVGTDVHLEPLIYDILETKSIIHRNYTSAKGNVFLSIVYYPDTKVDFHAPEACLGGAGGRLEKLSRNLSINLNGYPTVIGINELIRENIGYKELVYYFYKAGSYMGNSYFALRMNIAKNKLTRQNKSGALIRVSTTLSLNNNSNDSNNLTKFIEGLSPYLIKYF